MKSSTFAPRLRLSVAVVALALLGGCASVTIEQTQDQVNEDAASFTAGQLKLARSQADTELNASVVQQLLDKPVTQDDAVRLALANSPAMQALLAQGWADSADAARAGRIANPIFAFERLRAGDEIDIGRSLSLGLLDVLTLPLRQGAARRQIERTQLRLSGEVIDQVVQVRSAWIKAVGAQQKLGYAQQVYDAAEATAELARRMQSVGNFNRLSRAREQAFYADAGTQLASVSHQATSSRESLVRLLGLTDEQAQKLKLPSRFPDLPKEPLSTQFVSERASVSRLDVRLAQAELNVAGREQGLSFVTSLTDVELTARRNTVFDKTGGRQASPRGYEVAVSLPIFDWGGLQRDAMNARTLAAANRLEATIRAVGSGLRESYSAYRTAYDIARHHQDEVVPLRKVISEENQLRYNGMLIGVFELIADARDQVSTVVAAIDAQEQFWLADAALQASLIGRPTGTAIQAAQGSGSPTGGGGGH